MNSGSPHWASVAPDPNSEPVLAAVGSALRSAHRPAVSSRADYLCGLVRGRRVLDVGVVEHRAESRLSGQWLHRRLRDVASSCVGVDVIAGEVDALRAEGYDVRLHDLTVSPLDGEYDVIIAGEVIEHVGNPQALLTNCAAMLAPGGRVVVTTPNPYMVHRVWHAMRGRHRDSADHVALYGPSHLLELGRRSGLELDSWRGVRLKTMKTPKGRLLGASRSAISRSVLAPEISCDTLIYEFRLPEA